jgi:hypothetical protein
MCLKIARVSLGNETEARRQGNGGQTVGTAVLHQEAVQTLLTGGWNGFAWICRKISCGSFRLFGNRYPLAFHPLFTTQTKDVQRRA